MVMGARPRSAANALVKNGSPATAAAGSAIKAEIQWKRSRVSAVMSDALPAQTATDSSMTFIAAKPATASARTRRRISCASAASGRPGSKGWTS